MIRKSRRRRAWSALGLAGLVLALGSAPAGAHVKGTGAVLGVDGWSEKRLQTFERRVLGPGHAAEHARQRRRLRRPEVRAKVRQRAERARAAGQRRRAAKPPPRTAARIAALGDDGQWAAPFSIPVMGLAATLLPTGKVLWFAYPSNPSRGSGPKPNTAQAWLWDPATGATKRVDPPLWRDPADGQLKPANIWCGGLNLLADGRLLVTGGNLAYTGGGKTWKGLNKVYTFNPFNETWTEQPDMRHGRWYPSQVLMPDGNTLIVSGLDETGEGSGADTPLNRDIEIFTPSADMNGRGTVTLASGPAHPLKGMYPHPFVMPSGRTLLAGPYQQDSFFLTQPSGTSAYTTTEIPDLLQERYWGAAVSVPGDPSQVTVIGGSPRQASGGAVASAETFDEDEAAAGWRPAASLKTARAHENVVLLPDGSMLAVGGGHGSVDGDNWAAAEQHKTVELYDPDTGQWRLGPAQAENRAYHSTALLLPDGRVISAGDDVNGGTDRDTAEIYSPPYLFKGARPAITSAPGSVGWGATFTVGSADADVTGAALVAPGTTTHAVDTGQRYVPLDVTRVDGGYRMTAPANGRVAPPGYYMLFLLNADGVPSVAKMVKVGAVTPPVPPPPDPSATDLARGKPATSSGNENASLTPGKAVDGDPTTRWASAKYQTQPQWWQVDLGSQQSVNRVSINWEVAYASRYQIQTSTDGSAFTTAATVTLDAAREESTTFEARAARYVRVLALERPRSGVSFWDARVFGPGGEPPPPPPPPPPSSDDLALNRPATSSGNESSSLTPGNAVDGNSATRWASAKYQTQPQWWQVDLGSAKSIDRVVINWEVAYASRYSIETSTDGSAFTTAATVTLDAARKETTTFTARSARYVRVVALERPRSGVSFWDAEVYSSGTEPPPPPPPPPPTDVNVALGRPASASSAERSTLGAAQAVDGDKATRWASGKYLSTPQWWQVDLGSATTIGRVVVEWEAAYASEYDIQVSTDGTAFTTVATVRLDGAREESTTFPARSARYVRIVGTKRVLGGVSFWEARVYAAAQ